MINELDLQQFCGKSEMRLFINGPFSDGDYTYATDLHIAVRVSRRPGVSEAEHIPDMKKLFGTCDDFICFPITINMPVLPERLESKCSPCGGEGVRTENEHDECPSCMCEVERQCEDCEGTGKKSSDHHTAIDIFEVPFSAKYVRLLSLLPDLAIKMPEQKSTMYFKFKGGDGLLMPMNGGFINHLKDVVSLKK